MKDERYKKIMERMGMPNSSSLLSALQQVANVVAQEMFVGWQPIKTAPKDRPILMREKTYQPDLVQWRERRPECVVRGARWLAVPAGWFRLDGSRSHILIPTEWFEIPCNKE